MRNLIIQAKFSSIQTSKCAFQMKMKNWLSNFIASIEVVFRVGREFLSIKKIAGRESNQYKGYLFYLGWQKYNNPETFQPSIVFKKPKRAKLIENQQFAENLRTYFVILKVYPT